jgi:cell division protein ZapA
MEPMSDGKQTVKVNIFGTDYMIKGDAGAEHIRGIAEYLNQKMQEIHKSGMIKSSLKVAILAALNITDEYFKNREDMTKQLDAYERRIQKFIDLLETTDSPATPEDPAPSPVISEIESISLFADES